MKAVYRVRLSTLLKAYHDLEKYKQLFYRIGRKISDTGKTSKTCKKT